MQTLRGGNHGKKEDKAAGTAAIGDSPRLWSSVSDQGGVPVVCKTRLAVMFREGGVFSGRNGRGRKNGGQEQGGRGRCLGALT